MIAHSVSWLNINNLRSFLRHTFFTAATLRATNLILRLDSLFEIPKLRSTLMSENGQLDAMMIELIFHKR